MYVITGATGHIGNNLLRLMLDRGEHCRILLRKKGAAIEGLDVEACYGDVFDPAFLATHVARGDVLIHLAALIDLSNRHAGDTISTNFDGTRRIADFCAETGVRLVFISSVDAINKPAGRGKIAEPETFAPSLFKNDYARSKSLATAYVFDLLKSGRLQGCILYPSAVIGVHDYKPSAAGREIVRTFAMKFAFYIKGGYNFIDVRDAAQAIYAAARNGYDGTCILAAHPVTVKALYANIAAALGKRLLLLRIPVVFARLGTLFMRGFSNVMVDALQENYDYDNARMRRDLLPEPIPFDRTVADTVAWFKKRGSGI